MANPEVQKVTPALPAAAPGTVAVKVAPFNTGKPISKEDAEQVWVWYGSKRECPFYNLGLGGVTFARETHQTRRGAEGTPDQLVPLDGNFHRLSKLRIEQIKDRVARTVIRMGGGRAEIWDVTHDNYVPDVNDIPAGRFIYMQIVAEGQPFDRRADVAPSMT